MAIKNNITSAKKERGSYLTKRLLISATKRGIRKAAEETMQVMGYNIIARDGWVVKIFADGAIEKISQLKAVHIPNGIKLD